MFGSHLSIAGGLHNALLEAQRLGMETVQVFTANQRQWKSKPLTEEQITEWRRVRRETDIDQVVSHDSYLINLASPKPETWEKSVALFRDEWLRCESLGIQHVVTHPGSHLGEGEAQGLRRVAKALNQLHRDLPGLKLVTCLEVTAGQGTNLGHTFEHLRQIIDQTREPERLAVCLDTAHMLAAGYDLTSERGARRVLQELDEVLGIDRVRVIHMNDSKTPRGSRVDRHAHIGHGHVALDAFRVIVRKRAFRLVPKVLETAKDEAPDGRPWDVVNLETLRELAGRRPKPRSGSA